MKVTTKIEQTVHLSLTVDEAKALDGLLQTLPGYSKFVEDICRLLVKAIDSIETDPEELLP